MKGVEKAFNLSFNLNFKKSKKREMQIIYEHSNQFSMPLADSNLFALVFHNW